MEAYEGTPSPPVVLWSGSCAGFIEGLKDGLKTFCGEFMVLGGYRWAENTERGRMYTPEQLPTLSPWNSCIVIA